MDKVYDMLDVEAEQRKQLDQKLDNFKRQVQSQLSDLETKYQKATSHLEAENLELKKRVQDLENLVKTLLQRPPEVK